MNDENMELWNSVCETDPAHTKKVNQRGGFTAIDAMYQIQEATRQFGAVGVGWGWSYELIFPPNDTVIANVSLWHGKQDQVVRQAGQKKLNASNGADEDAAKKAITDGLTKCLSYLGFNADVFLGKFDDNKYVDSMKDKHKEVVPYEPTEDEKRTINDICHIIKCGQSEADLANVFEEYQVDMGEFGDPVCHDAINESAVEMKAVWKAGNQAQSLKYSFINVNHACDSYVEMKAKIGAFDNLPLLEAYYQKWKHRIDALEQALKADKYKRDGLNPHTTLANLYNKKLGELK